MTEQNSDPDKPDNTSSSKSNTKKKSGSARQGQNRGDQATGTRQTAGRRTAAKPRQKASAGPQPASRKSSGQPQPDLVLGGSGDEQPTYSIVGAFPVLGLNRSDLIDATNRLIRLLSLNPVLVARKEAAMALEMVRILAGRSEIQPDPKDRRFKDAVWLNNPYYKRLMQSYLLWCRTLEDILDSVDAKPRDKDRAHFMLMQITAAASPTNRPLGNPGFLDSLVKSRGLSLVRGLENFMDDLLHNGGMPSQVDKRPFKVGENLAVSPGAVVFRNPVCEVIQYQPRTPKVFKTPALVVPPQINKYYILDLAPGKSFVEYAVANQVPLFTISWRNPTAAQRDWGLETYLEATRDAIDAVREITGSNSVNVLAACAGGLTTAILMGHLWDKGESDKVSSLTLLVTVLDTSSEMLLNLFASDASMRLSIESTRRKGVLDGQSMARTFAWLRPTDLVWNYVSNNYLMGNKPPAFDVLYWNNDSTRLPAQFHADMLNLFRDNPLAKPGSMEVLGSRIDLSQVDCDVFIVSGINDHITPWKACYLSTRMFGGDIRFILSSSGHIQSFVNPPDNPKAKYFVNDDYSLEPDQWLKNAQTVNGSWWTYWLEWYEAHGGGLRDAPETLGSEQYPPGDAAPGRYVKQS